MVVAGEPQVLDPMAHEALCEVWGQRVQRFVKACEWPLLSLFWCEGYHVIDSVLVAKKDVC